jgi:hypothetical protein
MVNNMVLRSVMAFPPAVVRSSWAVDGILAAPLWQKVGETGG